MASRDLDWYRGFVRERAYQYRNLSPEAAEAKAHELYDEYLAREAALALEGKQTDLADDGLAAAIERRYREAHTFETPAAEAQLRGIVALEVEQAKITRRLAGKVTEKKRAELLTDLRQISAAHREAVTAAALDRKSLETAKQNASPMEKMDEQVGRFAAFMRDRIAKFPPVADHVESERDLREAIKYFGIVGDFELVDAIIRNVKRLNGLAPTVETYD